MNHVNVKAIQEIYAAFGKGDVGSIVSRCAADARWDFNGARPEVPWHKPVEGRDGIPRFIGSLMESVDMRAFVPREFIHCGPHVVVEIHLEYVVRKTGRKVSMDQLHWWSFDGDGRVSRLRHFEDTAQVLEAVR